MLVRAHNPSTGETQVEPQDSLAGQPSLPHVLQGETLPQNKSRKPR